MLLASPDQRLQESKLMLCCDIALLHVIYILKRCFNAVKEKL